MSNLSVRQSVEQFHLLFLDQLGKRVESRFYALKGGCNLRFFFNSIRYSEDIDLDINIVRKETLQKNIEQVLNSVPFRQILQTKGITIDNFSAPKQTSTTQRWKIVLINKNSAISFRTKIEFSRRQKIKNTEFEAVSSPILKEYRLHPILVNHYNINIAFEQKLEALLNRTQTQARDIFDLHLLLQFEVDTRSLSKSLRDRLEEAQTNALSVSYQEYKGQVLTFLPEDYRAQYDSKKIWDNMVVKLIDVLSELKK